MWTPTTRKKHNRKANRYQTDVTDEEWRPSALAVLRLIMSSNLVGEIKRWKLDHEVGDTVGWMMRMNATTFRPYARSPGDNPGFS
jgi:hypothetical protein